MQQAKEGQVRRCAARTAVMCTGEEGRLHEQLKRHCVGAMSGSRHVMRTSKMRRGAGTGKRAAASASQGAGGRSGAVWAMGAENEGGGCVVW